MEEYKVECYIYDKDNNLKEMNEHFETEGDYRNWGKKLEEKALGHYYGSNSVIKIFENDDSGDIMSISK